MVEKELKEACEKWEKTEKSSKKVEDVTIGKCHLEVPIRSK